MVDIIKKNIESKKFCVLTTGRAGSTSFMRVLEGFDDIIVPNKTIFCPNNELLHEKIVHRNMANMSKLVNAPIKTKQQLIRYFYEFNKDSLYAGFKSMPLFHRKDPGFLKREDIKFIVLRREDIPSTVASFISAKKLKTWGRKGGKHTSKFFIQGIDKFRTTGNIHYVFKSLKELESITSAIIVRYEELCQSDFNNPQLNDFFNRKIKLEKPVQPSSGANYIENWNWLKDQVEKVSNHY